ncbi:hypothetical protein ACIRBY_37105 [Streptomyces sp. NPDC096136]|uniref:hypothetical protein n=1 Tax=Streptomyces sp. NPDC096136 TaxID=3366076 RepID=UPI003821DF3D
MSQYDDSTRDVYDATTEAMAETIRLLILVAALAAEMAVEAREERLRLAREAEDERARAAWERMQAERASAEPLLRVAHQERFWEEPDPQRIARSWQAAAEWAAHGDPYAVLTLEHMRGELKNRFGIEVPQWDVNGEDLARLLALSDPAYRQVLEQGRAAAEALEGVSYAVVIRDADNPYAVAFQGSVSAPRGRAPGAVAAAEFQSWASGAGAEPTKGREGRFVTEIVENTGDVNAGHVPAAVVLGDQTAEILAEETERLHAIVAGTHTNATPSELLYALSVELEALEAEEWRRIGRREDYLKRMEMESATSADERRLQRLERNVADTSEGISKLRQERADTALRMAATAAEIRGENPARVYEAARLTDTLDDGWWATASAQEIAGVWEHVQQWEAGQARESMQAVLVAGVERQHGVVLPPRASPDMVAGLFGGQDRPGPAATLSARGEALRAEAQRAFEQSFDAFTRATRLEKEAAAQSGPYADELRVEAARLVEEATRTGERGLQLQDQGKWLDREADPAVVRMYADNSGQAAETLAAEFEARWGRPLAPDARGQLTEAVEQIYGNPFAVPTQVSAPREAGASPAVSSVEVQHGASTNPAGLVAIPVQAAAAVAEDLEEAADGQEDERRAAAAEALSGMGDAEAAEAARLGALGYPRGAEAATERTPAKDTGRVAEGREHGRQIERQGL